MGRLRMWSTRAAGFLRGARRSRELRDFEDELASHVEMRTDDHVRAGMVPAAARRQALLELGGVEQAKERYRDQQSLPLLDTLGQDLRLGWRMMRRGPGFTVIALIVLTLGIGANTVMFSVVNSLLLRPLPYPRAGDLQWVQTFGAEGQELATAVPDFQEYRTRNQSFDGLAAFYRGAFVLTGDGEPERIRALLVSPEFLSVLGVPPAAGRDLVAGDERWGEHRVALLADGFWRRRFAGDRGIVGRRITLNGESHTVIGVLPERFSFLGIDAQAVVPMAFAPGDNLNSHNNYFLTMVGRLRPGVATAAALGDLNRISDAIILEHPENRGTSLRMQPLQEALVGDVKPAVLVLFGAVGCVLLIACANLANLILARVAGRRREIALRIAIGAGRRRVLRQLLTENVLLASIGSVLALGLAWLSMRGLNALSQRTLPRGEDIQIDAAVLLFTAVVAVVTGVLFGIAPALRGVDVDPAVALKDDLRTAGDPRGRRLRGALVAIEVAMSLVLAIAAGLMLKSLQSLGAVDAGFDARNVVTAQVGLPRQKYVDPELELRFSPLAYTRASEFFAGAISELRGVPGVEAVGAISALPLTGAVWGKNAVLYDRPLPATVRDLPSIEYRPVAGDYFRALRIPIVSGRAFTDADTQPAAKVAIVNREMVRQHWPDADPIGKVISVNPPIQLVPAGTVPADYEPTLFTIVGVAADVRYGALHTAPTPLVYVPYAQGSEGELTMFLVVRTTGDANALAGVLRDRIRRVDPDIPASNVQTMEARVAASVAGPRLQTALLVSFAGLALLLAATGVYGVMSHAAQQRTREVGIRMAIGAGRRAILRLFLREGLAMVAIGIVAGLVGAAALTRALRSLLFEVSTTDPLVFGAITVVLGAVGLVAAWLPARRATRLDPVVALRET